MAWRFSACGVNTSPDITKASDGESKEHLQSCCLKPSVEFIGLSLKQGWCGLDVLFPVHRPSRRDCAAIVHHRMVLVFGAVFKVFRRSDLPSGDIKIRELLLCGLEAMISTGCVLIRETSVFANTERGDQSLTPIVSLLQHLAQCGWSVHLTVR